MLDVKDASNTIMTVILVATFLTIFYFTYVSHVEESIAKEQIELLVDDFTSDLQLLPAQDRELLKQNLKNVKRQNMSSQDQEMEEHNKKVVSDALTALVILNVIGIGIAYYLSYKYEFSFWEILKHNLIVLIFIALTEFIFLNVFVRNYISVEVNKVKLQVLDRLIEAENS